MTPTTIPMLSYFLFSLLPLLPYWIWVHPRITTDRRLFEQALREIQHCSIGQVTFPAWASWRTHQRAVMVAVLCWSLGSMVYLALVMLYLQPWQ